MRKVSHLALVFMETIAEYLRFLVSGGISSKTIEWPPDGFACAASLLERSGAYLAAVTEEWPPRRPKGSKPWTEYVRDLGALWRSAAVAKQPPPPEIQRSWKDVLAASKQSVQSICEPTKSKNVRNGLFEIMAAADEACQGAGIPGDDLDPFEVLCLNHLLAQGKNPSTLCLQISPSKMCVLPKMHTPQSGITIRSLSHHLGFCTVNEVAPRWFHLLHPQLSGDRHGLNVLVVPWPREIRPTDFSPGDSPLENMDSERFGFFRFHGAGGDPLDMRLLESVIEKANQTAGPVDVIVFPELALAWKDRVKLSNLIARLNPRPIVVGGMSIPATKPKEMGRNVSLTLVPLEKGKAFAWTQNKHHRWLLTGDQVKQYGLGGILNPTMNWWEHMRIEQRELAFFSMQPWLTFCTLICEDLARPDPVARLVRTVGPNLVFALLMDGPQLSNRWPARYGTVLADDPGSSVLTVSPLGMVSLSRPNGRPSSRVVALWKDARSGPIEIELPRDCEAVLLALTSEYRKEYSADGRHDEETTSYLTLSGVHPIKN